MPLWEPFEYRGIQVMSFKALDQRLGWAKGGAFRAFKHGREALVEGVDFIRLDGADNAADIEALKAQGAVYQTSIHVVLLCASGVDKLFGSPPRRTSGHARTG